MRYTIGKIFYDYTNSLKCIFYDPYAIEYYSFLRECRKRELHQIIITSEIMIEIIKNAYYLKKCKAYKIELMEEDCDAELQINALIKSIDTNPYQFAELLDFLNLIAEKSSVEIKKIYLKSFDKDKQDMFFIQSNGLIGINGESYENISNETLQIIKRCLFE